MPPPSLRRPQPPCPPGPQGHAPSLPRSGAAALPRLALALALPLLLAACDRTEPAGYSGYAEADLIYLASPGAGLLQDLRVQRGQQVAAGQALFALDTEPDRYASESAQAQRERARAQLADLNKGRRHNELQALAAQLRQAEAALKMSASQLARNRDLADKGFVSPQSLIDLQALKDRDAARVAELRAQLAAARDHARPDTIEAARAELHAASAALAQADWQRSQKARQAPTEATVFDVLFRPGEWVPAGQPVVVLQPARGVKLRFFVPQADLARVQPGQAVAYACDGCSGGRATVRHVSPRAEFTPPVIYSNESRGKLVFMVEAEPEPPQAGTPALKPGQPLTVHLP